MCSRVQEAGVGHGRVLEGEAKGAEESSPRAEMERGREGKLRLVDTGKVLWVEWERSLGGVLGPWHCLPQAWHRLVLAGPPL